VRREGQALLNSGRRVARLPEGRDRQCRHGKLGHVAAPSSARKAVRIGDTTRWINHLPGMDPLRLRRSEVPWCQLWKRLYANGVRRRMAAGTDFTRDFPPGRTELRSKPSGLPTGDVDTVQMTPVRQTTLQVPVGPALAMVIEPVRVANSPQLFVRRWRANWPSYLPTLTYLGPGPRPCADLISQSAARSRSVVRTENRPGQIRHFRFWTLPNQPFAGPERRRFGKYRAPLSTSAEVDRRLQYHWSPSLTPVVERDLGAVIGGGPRSWCRCGTPS